MLKFRSKTKEQLVTHFIELKFPTLRFMKSNSLSGVFHSSSTENELIQLIN